MDRFQHESNPKLLLCNMGLIFFSQKYFSFFFLTFFQHFFLFFVKIIAEKVVLFLSCSIRHEKCTNDLNNNDLRPSFQTGGSNSVTLAVSLSDLYVHYHILTKFGARGIYFSKNIYVIFVVIVIVGCFPELIFNKK